MKNRINWSLINGSLLYHFFFLETQSIMLHSWSHYLRANMVHHLKNCGTNKLNILCAVTNLKATEKCVLARTALQLFYSQCADHVLRKLQGYLYWYCTLHVLTSSKIYHKNCTPPPPFPLKKVTSILWSNLVHFKSTETI